MRIYTVVTTLWSMWERRAAVQYTPPLLSAECAIDLFLTPRIKFLTLCFWNGTYYL